MDLGESLLLAVPSGGDLAVRRCIERYGALVWSLARKYTPSNADAEDAVQDIFLDLWRSALRFDPAQSSEPAFVAMIARRRLVDLRRRRARREDEEIVKPDVPQSRPAGEERAEVSLVARAVGQLEAKERQVLVLATYDGLTQQEIADQTGMPIGTVKTLARRALIRVRTALDMAPAPAAAPRTATKDVEP